MPPVTETHFVSLPRSGSPKTRSTDSRTQRFNNKGSGDERSSRRLRRTMRLRTLLLMAVALADGCNPGKPAGTNRVVIATDNLDESQAIREIERIGGTIKRDDKLPGRPVTAVDFSRSLGFGDKDLYVLKTLKKLTTLNLSFTQITDVGLKELRELNNLTALNLSFTRITGAGLKELKELKNLTSLDLIDTHIMGTGLKELNHLTTLNLSFTADH